MPKVQWTFVGTDRSGTKKVLEAPVLNRCIGNPFFEVYRLLIINIEAQKNEPNEYDILNRAIFYVSRMISSQKEKNFKPGYYKKDSGNDE